MRALLKMILPLGLLLNTSVYAASIVDWSTVTLSGSFPDFTFANPTLGNVNLSYSADTEKSGIGSQFAVDTLITGNTGGESLTMSWTNSVTELDMEIWDIDAITGTAGEALTFATAATTSVATLHPTDVWDSSTLTLSSDSTPNDNSLVGNYTLMHFENAGGFNSITFDWSVASGTGTFGIGGIENVSPVPIPAAAWLFASALGVFGYLGKRKANA